MQASFAAGIPVLKKVALALVTTSALLAPAGSPATAAVCANEAFAVACPAGEELAERCLETLLACDAYRDILSRISAELTAPTATQRYYLGSALYGLTINSRSKALRCEYRQSAMDLLAGYLDAAMGRFRGTQSFGTVGDMKRLYHAAKLLRSLAEESGCLEDGLTIYEARRLATAHTETTVKAMFLTPDKVQGDLGRTARDIMGSIRKAAQDMISKASELETGIGLRLVQIKSCQYHLGIIEGHFRAAFGPLILRPDGMVERISTERVQKLWDDRVAPQHQRLDTIGEALNSALQSVDPQSYEAQRVKTIQDAAVLDLTTVGLANLATVSLFPLSPSATVNALREKLDVLAASGDPPLTAAIATMTADWKRWGEARKPCASYIPLIMPWYCR